MTEPKRSTPTAETWPIAAAMIQYPNILPDGRSVQDQPPELWAVALGDVAEAGFTEVDPTDSWLRIADLSPSRLDEFMAVARSLGLSVPAVSTARRSVIDPEFGNEFLRYSHRVIETAAAVGAKAVSFGLFGPLSDAQKAALWFWTEPGVRNPDDPAVWRMAVERIRELGQHAGELGLDVALEMYEDTYLGSADEAVRFVTDVDHPAVGLNPDIGNIIRLHRPVESWEAMVAKTAPFARYWHVKNYARFEDPSSGMILSHPTTLESGVINYRKAVSTVLSFGYTGAFLVENYGGDGLSISATNREYLGRILRRACVVDSQRRTV